MYDRSSVPAFRQTGVMVGIVLSTASPTLAREAGERAAVETTQLFAFHSDFATNLNDALIEGGRARNAGKPELFHTGEEESCFGELPRPVQAAWDHAVDYYAEIISAERWSGRQQFSIRLDLAGVEELKEARRLRDVGIARSFRGAAAPAYEACRWSAQDGENRRWIDALVPLLSVHEKAVSLRLADLYEQPLAGLPIRVDVVETVNWSGATTILLDPVGGHIVISNEADRGPVSLEYVFHEASHVLMGRGHPVRNALAEAAEQLGVRLPRDLWHAVLFYTTGDTVRRTLAEAGEPAYTPMIFSGNIFESFHEPMESAWRAYLEGECTLTEAALDLIRALGDGEVDSP
jgi:hypothetical protein